MANGQPPHDIEAALSRPPGPFLLRVGVIDAEMRALGLDPPKLALYAQLPPTVVESALASGRASKRVLFRLKEGLRAAHGHDNGQHITLAYLTEKGA